MNTPIAQMVALTCHGNAAIAGRELRPFFPSHSTCLFCDRVTFVVLEKRFLRKTVEKEVAATPDEWLASLRSAGALGVRIVRSPQNVSWISDRMTAGLVDGGGTWSMEVLLPNNRSDSWVARWEVWNRDAPENRIWRVTYGRVSSGRPVVPGQSTLADITSRLTQCLREIHAFSSKHQCGGFTQCFAKALDTLDSHGKNLHGYHKDLAPAGFLSPEVAAILDAAQSAWVFGGMGSWNDLGFEGDARKEYERVSDNLFDAVCAAIAAGASDAA